MLNQLRPALVLTAAMTIVTGLAYPFAMTGIAGTLMPAQASGSLVEKDGTVIGSSLIGQNFASDRYFWPRPSATSPDPYSANASSGSNLGTTSAKLRDRVAADVAKLKTAGSPASVPGDAVTTSGSGLDPHISPDYARMQIARVAGARGLTPSAIEELLARQTQGRDLGFVGEPRVNVLQLNMALDSL
ncbi:potassium-transporting ATPase subunit KdpC [Rhizobium sp. SAFR-030]|uniref:potassium-transporting ATPase subunit KdpC n=1 Tax=Rhizobium sp. SAFR-030 TaxID=3387277 RepID=UPI003F7E5FC2